MLHAYIYFLNILLEHLYSFIHYLFLFSGYVTLQYSTCTESDFDSIASEWLRFSQQRKKREVKENIPMEENIQE